MYPIHIGEIYYSANTLNYHLVKAVSHNQVEAYHISNGHLAQPRIELATYKLKYEEGTPRSNYFGALFIANPDNLANTEFHQLVELQKELCAINSIKLFAGPEIQQPRAQTFSKQTAFSLMWIGIFALLGIMASGCERPGGIHANPDSPEVVYLQGEACVINMLPNSQIETVRSNFEFCLKTHQSLYAGSAVTPAKK